MLVIRKSIKSQNIFKFQSIFQNEIIFYELGTIP